MWQALIAPMFALLDRVIPDPAAREAAKIQMMQADNQQALREMQSTMSAILAEAGSADPWTSRARPSFLYVIYALILASIPMGLVYAAEPDTAKNITEGFRAWLAAIPEPMVELFAVGYLGYTGARSFEKWKRLK